MEIEKFKKEEIDWKNVKCEFDFHKPLSNRKQEYIDTNRIGVYGDKFYMVNEKFEIIDEINIYDIKKVEKLQNEIYEINESLTVVIAILLCIILAIFSKNYLI